ncbi:MAG TPA: hypothetical protein VI503_03805, partial [Gaiellaceae bacterium]|nr:hypothetical protein [Gaiellaceae bacterium]
KLEPRGGVPDPVPGFSQAPAVRPTRGRARAEGRAPTLGTFADRARAEPHLYSFWLSGNFWDGEETEYTAPFAIEETGTAKKTARVPIGELGLRKGKRIAYVFDFGNEWWLLLKVVDRWEAEDESYPMLVEAVGTPPPQYPDFDEDLDEPDGEA